MAEDVIGQCVEHHLITPTQAGVTKNLHLLGSSPVSASGTARPLSESPGWHSYGSEQTFVQALPGAAEALCPGLTTAMVRFAARHEYALTVEDVLARRSRLLFLDARLAIELAPRVGAILLEETQKDPKIQEFKLLAANYLL